MPVERPLAPAVESYHSRESRHPETCQPDLLLAEVEKTSDPVNCKQGARAADGLDCTVGNRAMRTDNRGLH